MVNDEFDLNLMRKVQPMSRVLIFALILGFTSAMAATQAADSDKKAASVAAEVIPADKARDHIDKTVTVELTVKSAKNVENREVYYLDSEEDYKAEANLALVISYEAAKDFKKAGVDDVIEYYMNKKIRVTGKVIHQSEQTRMIINHANQVELVK